MKDTIFSKPTQKQFEFDESVASVFDDMLSRSVPFYKDVISLCANFANKYVNDSKIIYDLGCSTGSLLLEIHKKSDKNLRLIGVDESKAMIDLAQKKSIAYGANLELFCDDILKLEMIPCDVVLLNYTLQFIRPIERENLCKKIYNSLQDGGILIISEKVISDDKKFHKILIDEYYNFKRSQGYSEYEISQKREALENILIPYTDDENKKMLNKAGFIKVETVFKWVNFATFIAFKN